MGATFLQGLRSLCHPSGVAKALVTVLVVVGVPLKVAAAPFGLHGAPLIDVGILASSVVTADFNKDGHADLAVASDGSEGLSVLLGNGRGEFGAPRRLSWTRIFALVAADYDGNGTVDLLATDFQGVAVFLGDGTGAFPDMVQGPFDTFARFFNRPVEADFDGNGLADRVTIDPQFCEGDGVGSVLIDFAFPDGSSTQRQFAVHPCATAFTTGDFNGDGRPDVAVVNTVFAGTERPPSAGVGLLINDGRGGFQASSGWAAGIGGQLAVGDFDGDGVSDLAVTNGYYVTILFGTRDGQPKTGHSSAEVGGISSKAAVADFDGDGFSDIAIANRYSPDDGGASNLTLLFGAADGSLGRQLTLVGGNYPVDVVAADINGDRRLDLIVANGQSADLDGDQSLSIFTRRADGEYDRQDVTGLGAGILAVTAADLTGDGTADIVATGNATWFVRSGPTGELAAPAVLQPSGTFGRAVAVGDFDRDGIPDIIVGEWQGIDWLRGLGEGRFAEAVHTTLSSLDVTALAVGDLNGDGDLDVVITTTGNATASASILLGRGDGSFRTPFEYPLQGFPASIAIRDFDGDGVPDLAVAVQDGVAMFRGDGPGTFEAVGGLAGYGSTVWVGTRPVGGGEEILALGYDGHLLSYGSALVRAPQPNFQEGGGCAVASASPTPRLGLWVLPGLLLAAAARALRLSRRREG